MRHTLTCLALLSLSIGAPGLQAQTKIDIGQASVSSAQGQRLKVQLPYGSKPGEQLPVTRVMVESVSVPEGFVAPSPGQFTISQPERRNVLTLHSRELVNAPKVELVLSLANTEPSRQTITLDIPPQSFSPVAMLDASPKAVPKKKPRKAANRARSASGNKAMKASANTNCNCATPEAKVMVAPK
jgi:hypothetical protein